MNPHTYESLRRPDPYEHRPAMRALREVVIAVYLIPMLYLLTHVIECREANDDQAR